jgi:translation initiation factor 4G
MHAVFQLGRLVSDDPEEEKRQKEFKSHLNKITPDNYETIKEKILAIGIKSPTTLTGLISQVSLGMAYCCA